MQTECSTLKPVEAHTGVAFFILKGDVSSCISSIRAVALSQK